MGTALAVQGNSALQVPQNNQNGSWWETLNPYELLNRCCSDWRTSVHVALTIAQVIACVAAFFAGQLLVSVICLVTAAYNCLMTSDIQNMLDMARKLVTFQNANDHQAVISKNLFHTNKNLSTEVVQLKATRVSLQEQVSQIGTRLQETAAQHEEAKKNNANLSKQIEELYTHTGTIKALSTGTLDTLRTLSTNVNNAQIDTKGINKEINRALAEIQEQNKKSDELQKIFKTNNSNIEKTLQEIVTNQNAVTSDYLKKLSEYKEEIEGKKIQAAVLQEKLQILVQDYEKNLREHQAQTERLMGVRKELETASEQLKHQTRQLTDATAQNLETTANIREFVNYITPTSSPAISPQKLHAQPLPSPIRTGQLLLEGTPLQRTIAT